MKGVAEFIPYKEVATALQEEGEKGATDSGRKTVDFLSSGMHFLK